MINEIKEKMTAEFRGVFGDITKAIEDAIAKATEAVREELDGLRGEVHELVERIEVLKSQ